jgi:hypothetical protein
VRVEHVLAEPLAEEHLGVAGVRRRRHEADDVVVQLRECGTHLVEAVLRLDEDLVEPVAERPGFLLLGERAKMPLATPVASRAADPLIQHPPAVELDDVVQLRHEVGKLGIVLFRAQFVRHLERNGHDGTGVVGQRCFRHQNLVIAIAETRDHFVGGFLPGKVEEELLDVLDFQCSLVEPVLLQGIFHSQKRVTISASRGGLPASRYSARSAITGSTRVARRAGR